MSGFWTRQVLNAAESQVIVFVPYVHDLVMFCVSPVADIIKKVRANTKMDDPTDLKK